MAKRRKEERRKDISWWITLTNESNEKMTAEFQNKAHAEISYLEHMMASKFKVEMDCVQKVKTFTPIGFKLKETDDEMRNEDQGEN